VEPADQAPQQPGDLLPYGVLKRIQAALAGIRTDLDSFSDAEAHALMASGYLMTRAYADGIRSFPQHPGTAHQWDFLAIESALGGRASTEKNQDHFEKLLRVGAQRAFKVWSLSKVLSAIAIALGVAALVLLVWGWFLLPDGPLLPFDRMWLASTVLGFAATLFLSKGLLVVIRYKTTVRKFLKDLGIALVGWIGARIHLTLFDPLFLRKGSIQKVQ